ncbi:MAG: hypothetical protein LWW93_12020 [Hyphomicrobiales bacterium]|nr:hypothetical protein [Hyphomicrobiales bacterium]
MDPVKFPAGVEAAAELLDDARTAGEAEGRAAVRSDGARLFAHPLAIRHRATAVALWSRGLDADAVVAVLKTIPTHH